jgi:tetratricopeptide (TPR) repeat protein
MKIPLTTPVRKGITVTIAFILATAYVGFALTQFLASWFGNKTDLASLHRAAWLDPGNAEYRDHLGRYYDLVARDPSSAVKEYRAAVALNPHSARYWFDLAGAYQVLGDTPRQTDALEHAIQADATTPDVAWEAGNLYLVQGENEKALRELSVVVANDPSLLPSALQLCWRIRPDIDGLLHDTVPARADAYTAFLTILESKQETEATKKVWHALMRTNDSFGKGYAYDYIHYLLLHKEVAQAELVWQQATLRFGLTAYLPSSENLVVNGNFEMPVLNAGFDWQYQKQPSVRLTLDPSDFHSGRRSLEITFDGPAISDAGIYQFIVVQPNTSYEFTAYYKNTEMEGAGGPHFTIQDEYGLQVYYESDELKDAGFWKSAYGEFTTSADCTLIALHIRRLPAGSPIRGKLWIDDFHIVRKPS